MKVSNSLCGPYKPLSTFHNWPREMHKWWKNVNNLRCLRHDLSNILKPQAAFCIQFITHKQVKLVSFSWDGSISCILILAVFKGSVVINHHIILPTLRVTLYLYFSSIKWFSSSKDHKIFMSLSSKSTHYMLQIVNMNISKFLFKLECGLN